MTLKQRVDKQDRQIKALHTLLKRGFAAQVDATIRDIYDTAMRSRFEQCLDSPWAKISARLEDIVGMLNMRGLVKGLPFKPAAGRRCRRYGRKVRITHHSTAPAINSAKMRYKVAMYSPRGAIL